MKKKEIGRKNDIFLKKVHSYKGSDHFYKGKVTTLSDYEGVDIQTGEILKICNVNKIAKDAQQNGIYVYSAYIDRTDDENEMFLKTGEPIGSPVVFETAIKVDDMIASNDKQMINSLLTLLSTKTQQNSEQMKYIGAINRNGQISDNYISQTFAQRIPAMIDKFNKDIEIEKQNKSQRNY